MRLVSTVRIGRETHELDKKKANNNGVYKVEKKVEKRK